MFLFEALFSSLQQATHQLQGICSAERCFFEAIFFIATSSPSAAGDSISGKIFFQALFFFIAHTSSSSAAGDMLSRKVLFRGFLLCIATSPSSAAGDSFSAKVFSRLSSLYCNKLPISCRGFDQRKGFFRGSSLHCNKLFIRRRGSSQGKGFFSRLSSPHCNKLFISLLCLCDLLREGISKGRTQQGIFSSSNHPS